MREEDFAKFRTIWSAAWGTVGKGSFLTEQMISDHFRLLKLSYTVEQIAHAAEFHMGHASSGILPKDVHEFYGERHDAALEAIASDEFNAVANALAMPRDIMVFGSPRTAYAVKVTWGSLNLAMQSPSKYRENNRRGFIQRWVDAGPTVYQGMSQVEFIDMTKPTHSVGFIGDREECWRVCEGPQLAGVDNLRLPDRESGEHGIDFEHDEKLYNGHKRSEYPPEARDRPIDPVTGVWLDSKGITRPGPGDHVGSAREVAQAFIDAGLGSFARGVFQWLSQVEKNSAR